MGWLFKTWSIRVLRRFESLLSSLGKLEGIQTGACDFGPKNPKQSDFPSISPWGQGKNMLWSTPPKLAEMVGATHWRFFPAQRSNFVVARAIHTGCHRCHRCHRRLRFPELQVDRTRWSCACCACCALATGVESIMASGAVKKSEK